MIEGEEVTLVCLPWGARTLPSVKRLCEECGIDVAVDENNTPRLEDGTVDLVVCALCSVEKILNDDRVMAGGKPMTIAEAVTTLRERGLIP